MVACQGNCNVLPYLVGRCGTNPLQRYGHGETTLCIAIGLLQNENQQAALRIKPLSDEVKALSDQRGLLGYTVLHHASEWCKDGAKKTTSTLC